MLLTCLGIILLSLLSAVGAKNVVVVFILMNVTVVCVWWLEGGEREDLVDATENLF